MSYQSTQRPRLTCCERGRRFVSLRFEDHSSTLDSIVDSTHRVEDYLAWARSTTPAWTIFVVSGPERGVICEPESLSACPFCQQRTPDVRLRAHPPQPIRVIVDGGYDCDTCAERLDACEYAPVECLWEAVDDGTGGSNGDVFDGAVAGRDLAAGVASRNDGHGNIAAAETSRIPPRTVTCAWCKNRYRSAVPSELDRGVQGCHCASDVLQDEQGRWIVRSGYGSDNDLDTFAFVANPPSQPADPICDECISDRIAASDLAPLSPSAFRRPEDFAPRPAGLWRITQKIRDQAKQIVAMRRLIDVACREHGPSGISHPVGECLLCPCELCEAVEAYQKFQRWTGELQDEGDLLDDIAAAKILRESARDLEGLADFCERQAASFGDRADTAPSDPGVVPTSPGAQ